MDDDPAEAIKRFMRDEADLEDRIDTEARATAHALIHGHIGPDHTVTVLGDFYSALVQALKAARKRGQVDHLSL